MADRDQLKGIIQFWARSDSMKVVCLRPPRCRLNLFGKNASLNLSLIIKPEIALGT
jgi:hypothetical protein